MRFRTIGFRTIAVVFMALAVIFAGIVTSQGLATRGNGNGGNGNTYVRTVTGSDAPGAVGTVDGLPAAQAPGVFQQGTPVAMSPDAAAAITPVPLAAPDGCRNAGVNWEAGLNAFGLTMWKIWNHTYWCFSNWQVTSVTGWTDVYTAVGWSSSNVRWNWAWWNQPATARSYSQAHFCLLGYFGCLQTADPTVNTWVNGAGNYSFDLSNWYPGT